MNCAFKLRRENHVHENDRQNKGPDEFCESSFQLARAAGNGSRISGRKIHLSNRPTQRLNAVRQSEPWSDGRSHGDLSLAVESINTRRAGIPLDLYKVIKPHQASA